MPDPHDLAKSYYSAARAEVIQRLAMREQVLLAGVTAFGVIGGLALSSGEKQYLFALCPFLSFAFTVLLFRHHFLMIDLGRYIRSELNPLLGITGTTRFSPIHWDNWLRNKDSSKRLRIILAMELAGAWLLLWLPGLIGAVIAQVSYTIKWVDGILLAIALLPFLLELRDIINPS
jgi:hypothetical protein